MAPINTCCSTLSKGHSDFSSHLSGAGSPHRSRVNLCEGNSVKAVHMVCCYIRVRHAPPPPIEAFHRQWKGVWRCSIRDWPSFICRVFFFWGGGGLGLREGKRNKLKTLSQCLKWDYRHQRRHPARWRSGKIFPRLFPEELIIPMRLAGGGAITTRTKTGNVYFTANAVPFPSYFLSFYGFTFLRPGSEEMVH